jgi:tetratricopeptide (TPR) repeat protein
MRLLRTFLTSFLVFVATTAWAGHITGQVRFENGQLADNVRVQLRSDMIAFQTETQTDRQGRFTFDGLPLTTFHLWVEFPGYHPYNTTIDISMSKMSYEDVALRRDHTKDEPNVAPEGPRATLDARQAQIPPDARAEFDVGKKCLDANDVAGAIAHLQKAVELFPNYAEAYQLIGGAYLGTGNFALAEVAFVKAVTIEDRLANAQLALGLTRNLMGNTPAAEKPLERAVQLNPNNPDAHFELAKNKFALQRYSEAQAHAEKSLELKPQNAPVYIVLGYTLLRQKKAAEAERAFQHFLQIAPTSPMATDIKQTIAMIEQHEKNFGQH